MSSPDNCYHGRNIVSLFASSALGCWTCAFASEFTVCYIFFYSSCCRPSASASADLHLITCHLHLDYIFFHFWLTLHINRRAFTLLHLSRRVQTSPCLRPCLAPVPSPRRAMSPALVCQDASQNYDVGTIIPRIPPAATRRNVLTRLP